jgi:hypothetical protein
MNSSASSGARRKGGEILPTGKVVGVLKRNWRSYVATIRVSALVTRGMLRRRR